MNAGDVMDHEIAFEMATSNLRFGAGVTREVGTDLVDLGVRTALVVTDPKLSRLPPVLTVLESLAASGVKAVLFDRVRVEPTDESFRAAIQFAEANPVDGIVAVGGGSVIDTAKAVNLYTTYPPADFLDYVNAPIGKAFPVPGSLKPLIAVPTTAGTGSETTGVSIFDLTALHAKTGIANRRLKPTLGVLDPENTRTMPKEVAASSGLDILSHAVESFTAIPYTSRPRPSSPTLRPAYQGSNPISDIWALQALRMVAQYLIAAVEDPGNDNARAQMILAASYAGVGFGNAGVHLPHGMSYPVSGHVKSYPRARLSQRPRARPARRLRDPQRAGGVSLYRVGQSIPASAGGRSPWRQRDRRQGCRCRTHSRRPHYLVHAAAWRSEWIESGGLLIERHSTTGRRHIASAPRDQAIAASCES
jgi:hydroxyacid-oxoacid transhydrogenase